jgi:hypothetical protein
MAQPETPIAEAPNVCASIKAIVFVSCEMSLLQAMHCVDFAF